MIELLRRVSATDTGLGRTGQRNSGAHDDVSIPVDTVLAAVDELLP